MKTCFYAIRLIYHDIKNSLTILIERIVIYQKFKSYPPKGCQFKRIENIFIGKGFSCGQNCIFLAQDNPGESKIIIEENVKLNGEVTLNADKGGKIHISSNVLIGPRVIMRASNHNFSDRIKPIFNQGHSSGKIFIGEGVWIGANVTILPNVTIGTGSIIAAGSVVTKNIPPYQIAAGIPAKVIRER